MTVYQQMKRNDKQIKETYSAHFYNQSSFLLESEKIISKIQITLNKEKNLNKLNIITFVVFQILFLWLFIFAENGNIFGINNYSNYINQLDSLVYEVKHSNDKNIMPSMFQDLFWYLNNPQNQNMNILYFDLFIWGLIVIINVNWFIFLYLMNQNMKDLQKMHYRLSQNDKNQKQNLLFQYNLSYIKDYQHPQYLKIKKDRTNIRNTLIWSMGINNALLIYLTSVISNNLDNLQIILINLKEKVGQSQQIFSLQFKETIIRKVQSSITQSQSLTQSTDMFYVKIIIQVIIQILMLLFIVYQIYSFDKNTKTVSHQASNHDHCDFSQKLSYMDKNNSYENIQSDSGRE